MNINDDKYYVSEIFESIQGEGNYAGVHSLFIRFLFCNLSCIWCDTKYTWLEKSGSFKQYSVSELRDIISKSKPYHVIFTGGEPSFYRLDRLFTDNKKFHVETNGTIIPDEPLNLLLKDDTQIVRDAMDYSIYKTFNWVVSPKLSNSTHNLNEKGLQYWAEKDFSIFKFVICNLSDIDEVEQIIKSFKIDKRRVFIGLEGITLQSQLRPELVNEIVKRGFNYSPRLHILLWGAVKGK